MHQSSIIKGCIKGEEAAFKALVDQYAPKLMSVCKRYLKEEDQAKDALQECFISIFKSIHSYNGSGSFEGWISKIAVNACLKEIKSKRPLQEICFLEFNESQFDRNQENLNVEDILTLVNELSEMHRIVFNMNIIEGYSHQEIGALLNISESSSRVYLSRARKILQDRIENTNDKHKILFNYK